MAVRNPSRLPEPAVSPTPQARIILATIECLERFGVTGTTVRRITEAAGVNVAAINYYFGDKEALLEAALAQSLDQALPKALAEASPKTLKASRPLEKLPLVSAVPLLTTSTSPSKE